MDPGTRLGIYEITGTLGKGGMGEVYRARDTKLEREVAIKTLPASLAYDKDRLARFEREAKLLASLNHAHIASVYGLDEHEGTLYIAMELVEGETLEQKLETGALPVEDALRLGLQIAEALEAAHDKGVVHRDLKPANVMVTANGVVKVLDFGLAKAFSGDPAEASPAHSPALSMAMTQAGLVLGTAGYMSPEQASGQATDQRADVWAFGVVLYEMLTGLPLFSGESVPHILADVLRADPDWGRLPKNLHPRIRELLERCLEKKPRSRYAGISDARADIEAALKDPEGVTPARPTASAETALPVPRHRQLLPWAAGLVLALAAGVAAWTLKTPEPKPVVRMTVSLPEQQAFSFPGLGAIDISPDGTMFAYSMREGLYLRVMDSFEGLPIPGLGAVGAVPRFSPDGRSLVRLRQRVVSAGATSNEVELARFPVTGGAERPLAVISDSGDIPYGMSWEADGSILYPRRGGIWRVSENGGEPEQIVSVPGQAANMPSLLPGGEWLLYSLADTDRSADWDRAQIVIESLVTGERRELYRGGSSARYVPTGHLVFAFGNTLYALPFDAAALEVHGGPTPIVQEVWRNSDSGIAQYAFSKTGTLLYAPGRSRESGTGTLGVVSRTASVEPLPMPPGDYADPRVAPDGSRAAYTRSFADGDDIEVYDLAGSTSPRRLTFGGMSRLPVWSADSARVAFQSMQDGTPSLYWQPADGSGGEPARLTTAAEGETHVADSFSPDGRYLTFSVASEGGTSVWLLDLETNESERLIEVPDANVSQSVFSPKGEWLAYQSDEQGSMNVFVVPFPLTGARYQVPPTVENHHPAFSADGSEIFYFPESTGTQAIAVMTDGSFRFGSAEALVNWPMNTGPTNHRQYDVMPDGSGALGVVGDSAVGGAPSIRVVLNWFEELKAQVPVD